VILCNNCLYLSHTRWWQFAWHLFTLDSYASWCQFHQHSTYEFFIRTSVLAVFASYMYVEKAAKTDIRTKNSYVECWWNWRLGQWRKTGNSFTINDGDIETINWVYLYSTSPINWKTLLVLNGNNAQKKKVFAWNIRWQNLFFSKYL